MPFLIELDTPLSFTQFDARADTATPGVYDGVLIIQKGIAKGHYAVQDGGSVVSFDRTNPEHTKLRKYQIVIGTETLDDVIRCADGQSVKCKLDHGATVRDIVGNYSAFQRDGDQVRAALKLMKSSPHRGYVEELFSDFAKKVGNSIDFVYRYEIQGDVAVARCVKLNSVDIVDAPAATNSLFTENLPNQPAHMPLDANDLKTIGDLLDNKFTALQTGIETRLGKIETTVTKLEEGDDDDDEKKKKKEGEDDAEKMSAMIKTATLAAVREVLPKATVDNLASLAAGNAAAVKDEYAEKLALCEAAGITGGRAIRHIREKFPTIYNAKFGQPAQASARI